MRVLASHRQPKHSQWCVVAPVFLWHFVAGLGLLRLAHCLPACLCSLHSKRPPSLHHLLPLLQHLSLSLSLSLQQDLYLYECRLLQHLPACRTFLYVAEWSLVVDQRSTCVGRRHTQPVPPATHTPAAISTVFQPIRCYANFYVSTFKLGFLHSFLYTAY